jgi:hypothetical protein
MKKKLTLVIDEEIIERAKRHARSVNTSVSDLVELYLVEQTRNQTWTPPSGSVLARITGAISPDVNHSNDDERREKALRDKYA